MRRRLRQSFSDLKYIRLGVPRVSVRPSDCFLVSWPRSGNTWLRQMVANALYPEREWDLLEMDRFLPAIEDPHLRARLPDLESQPFRVFKSHDDAREYLLRGRVVYVIRDGRDAITSFYHYRTKLNRRDFTFREFLENTLTGRYRYGPWHRHVERWLDYEGHPSVLTVRYRAMLDDPAGQLCRVLEHFGAAVSDCIIERAVERTSIDCVHRGFQKYARMKGRDFSGGLGGGHGKHRELFAPEDERLFLEHAGDVMRRLGFGGECEPVGLESARAGR